MVARVRATLGSVLRACSPFFLLALAGCASTEPRLAVVMDGPDGHLWIPVRCSVHLQCLRRAAFFCPAGYKVEGQEAHTNLEYNAATYHGAGLAHGSSELDETMLVQCKTCAMNRAFRVDGDGNFSHDPERNLPVKLCPGGGTSE